MITHEIDALLSDVDEFAGTYACNKLPDVRRRPAFLVVNTAKLPAKPKSRIVDGEHWIAIRLSQNENEYFDSFGEPPRQSDIIEYLAKQNKALQYNTQMLQDPKSDVCGVYCIDFIRHRARNISFRKYLSTFTANVVVNDQMVVDRVTWQS